MNVRYVPYMTAHFTDVKGISTINSSDNRFFNNVFAVGEDGADPFVSEGNAVICNSKVEASYYG